MKTPEISCKFSKMTIIVLICLATTVAIFDSCEAIYDRYLYEVNSTLCNTCKKCLPVCPVDAIKLVEGKAKIDSKKCIGCGRCMRVCKEQAISPV